MKAGITTGLLALLLAVAPEVAQADSDGISVLGSGNGFKVLAKRHVDSRLQRPRSRVLMPTVRAVRNPCPGGQTAYTRWVKTRTSWTSAPKVVCLSGPPGSPTVQPVLTAGMVLQAFRRIPLPHPRAQTQPGPSTLVNLDTIFYVNQGNLTRSVTLLGQRVTLRIRPSQFVWRHGDGTSATTATPGTAYPGKEITYRYRKAGRVWQSVSIVWSARYSVNGGPSQPVPGTVTTVGPSTRLRVREAVPVLSERSVAR